MTAATPVIISERPGRHQKVLRANGAARQAGITPGMRVAAALALATDLQIIARDTRAEDRALRRLAAWAGQYSSQIHLDSPSIVLLEVGGSLRLFGELTRLVEEMGRGITELGYHAQWSVAPTKLAATWFAQTMNEIRITDPNRLVGALSRLPLSVLGLAPRSVARLKGMGVKCLGDCLRLPRAGLARRMGTDFLSLLDRACGRAPDPRARFVPETGFEARLELPAAVEQVQALVFALKRLLMELCGELRGQDAGVIKLSLRLCHPRVPVTLIEPGLVTPSRDPEHLLRLFNERLAQTALPEPVTALELRAPRYLPLKTGNLDLFDTRKQSTQSVATLVERLRVRLGEQAVQGLQTVAEHRPERAYDVHLAKPMPAPMPVAARPLWLLSEPIALQQQGGRPWLGGVLMVQGDTERIESGWWDGADVRRDYFVAHNAAGETYWIFRELRAPYRWWLHGIFG
jgi:protein ImuB